MSRTRCLAIEHAAAMCASRERPQTTFTNVAHCLPAGPTANYTLKAGTRVPPTRMRDSDTGQHCERRTTCGVCACSKSRPGTTFSTAAKLGLISRCTRMNIRVISTKSLLDAATLRGPVYGRARLHPTREIDDYPRGNSSASRCRPAPIRQNHSDLTGSISLGLAIRPRRFSSRRFVGNGKLPFEEYPLKRERERPALQMPLLFKAMQLQRVKSRMS